MSFTGLVGTGAIISYVLAIIFDNVGFASLALGLTYFALNSGGV